MVHCFLHYYRLSWANHGDINWSMNFSKWMEVTMVLSVLSLIVPHPDTRHAIKQDTKNNTTLNAHCTAM